MIKLNLEYLRQEISGSMTDFCEAGSTRSVKLLDSGFNNSSNSKTNESVSGDRFNTFFACTPLQDQEQFAK